MIHTYCITENERDNVKVWGAIIEGKDKKYGFKRNFKSYRHLISCSSKHAYYNYYIDIPENAIVEVRITGMYKKKSWFIKNENGIFKNINFQNMIESL